jgi:uncharacterized membrane protein YphA (DoxX/SURF4 family)
MAAHVRTLLRWLLGALILATGIGKALDVGGFAGVLADYRLGLDDDALSILALMVCALEIGLGAWLLSGRRLRRAAATAMALNAAYCVLMTTALLRGLQLDNCGCFGVYFPSPLRWYSPLEDVALVAASWALMRLAPMAE